MRQAALKIKTGAVKVAGLNLNDRTKILRAIFILFGVFAISYVLLIGTIIFNIVERKMLESEARALASAVGELELSYLNAYQNFDASFARELGFVEAKPDFAVRSVFVKNTVEEKEIKVSKNEI